MKKLIIISLCFVMVGCGGSFDAKQREFKNCMGGEQSSEKFTHCKEYVDFIFGGVK